VVRSEYIRFLQTLNNPDVPNNVRKIANLVLAHLDELVPLTTTHGQRIKKVVALAQGGWDAVSANIDPLPENYEEQREKVFQLKSLTVGPFRGFAKQEVFDLASRLVLIYGPNGTGKSSFCEALEYGLLGNVVEAENRRFREPHEYFKNAHVNQFSPPNITAEDEQGEEISVTPNEMHYRFCFVEKNRIDSFARIAAQTPAKQSELISTLFGLDSFSEFVRNFTEEMDQRYIDLVGEKSQTLLQKRQKLVDTEQQIKTNTEQLQEIVSEEQQLANQYREGTTFSQMLLELKGNEETPGKIRELELELQQSIAAKSNLTSENLNTLRSSIDSNIENLIAKQKQLTAVSQQVSFKQLYEAIFQLQQSNSEQCPACQTPISQTTVDPYIHASEELQKLHQLGALQEDEKRLNQNIQSTLFKLSQIINACLKLLPQENILQSCQLQDDIQADISWYHSLFQIMREEKNLWQRLVEQIGKFEQIDAEINQITQIRTAKQAELSKLRNFSEQITKLQTRRETAANASNADQLYIQSFNTENAQLIADVGAEKAVIQRNQGIATAYSAFVKKLVNYNNNLPTKLVADLGDFVLKLYNAFNRSDAPIEQLADVKLPLTQNQRLKIAFRSTPKRFHDALHVLSEGHIRCMGLAILLAKNLKEKCPLLIFDDPINAIDDDHRESIRLTLFKDSYFSNKQIILACHGEEFFKDIYNLLNVETAKKCRSLTFLPRLNEPHINIDFNCTPRNYIIAARTHFERGEIRGALDKSRKALESLTKGRVWSYVGKHGDANLSIKLRSPSAPIELRNLTEQLRSKIDHHSFSDPNKHIVLRPITTLLGFDGNGNGNSREWRYLNKGTHEEQDRVEFDRSIVSEIISNLEKLDEALA
jgi:AAA15 family ATPase/GTPase